ncbi:MAG TPA: leucine--tRNA ligase [Candidatus Paceibacterota bacterium]
MKDYDHKKIEKKWQAIWEKNKIYQAKDNSKKPKFYGLIEFPYPSGDGMHVGHIRSNTAMDVIVRKRRAEGYNVIYPIGWDAFGLPTENYAIKTGQQPSIITKKNTDTFRRQLKAVGFSFDWSREVNTTDPKYYKWTQWLFLQFLKKGLAYKKKMFINWCPKDKIGLANEEVVAGCCERCGTVVEKREKEQWMLAITKYAERLDKDLDTVDYLPQIKLAQRNWIGKSNGAEIDFSIEKSGESIKVFTTRSDTVYGATYMVLSPEHELVLKLKPQITNWDKVMLYVLATKAKNEIERTNNDKEKTGVELEGVKAINPATSEPIPVWIADYVLAGYGTGAIMAVPAHDERDFEFATKFNLEIKLVVNEEGKLVNSGRFDGQDAETAKKQIVNFVGGQMKTTFKLRDWVFSRQRYWGEPIPVVHCVKCRIVPVPDKDLPVELPKVKNYQPTDSGESPLANISKWVNTKCPKCGGKAKRETDTMPNWAGSSWYYLRYTDPKNAKAFASAKNLKYWLGTDPAVGGVDWYNGGNEHTTLHLLYSRFWHKFLYDLKLVPTREPYMKRTSHGIILDSKGDKMSKSRGNVINPDVIVSTYGADTLRLYEMFIGPFDQAITWSEEAIIGPRRFLEKVWKIGGKVLAQKNFAALPTSRLRHGQNFSVPKLLNKTIKKVTEDIENMRFNTAISSMMILATEMERVEYVDKKDYKKFLQILAPFAPHMAEELWMDLGEAKSVSLARWPKWDESLLEDEEVKIVIQVNGKVRAEMMALIDATEEDIKQQALAHESVLKYVGDVPPQRVIYVKGRLINIVI